MIEVIANDRLGRKGMSLRSSHHLALTATARTNTVFTLYLSISSSFPSDHPTTGQSRRPTHSPSQMSPYGYDRRSQETHRCSDGYDRFQDPVEEVVRLLLLLYHSSGTGKMERVQTLISMAGD